MPNSSHFVALPVNQGDAFLLERFDGKSILVDGGKSKAAIPSLIHHEGTPQLDVVVCTHADADHAEGIAGLLADGSVPMSEVWLPGRWTDRLRSLCTTSDEFIRELWSDVVKNQPTDLERYGDELASASRERASENENPGALDDDWQHGESVEPATSDYEDQPDDPFADILGTSTAGDYLDSVVSLWGLPPSPLARVFIQAVQTAQRIRSIAQAAHHHGARIRWFDFGAYHRRQMPWGGEPFLQPLNSVEITPSRQPLPIGALEFLALSIANRESLVFLAPETDDDPATLFCADSDLRFPIPPVTSRRTMIATAPHHGSEANSAAYSIVRQCTRGNVQWLRSDGKFARRPGQSFLAERVRSCTLCRAARVPKQAIRLTVASSGWALDAGVRPCGCL